MANVLVVADDYTGALDTGVQFTASGASVYVTTYVDLCMPFDTNLFANYDVLVVDAESRHLTAEQADLRVGALTREAARCGFSYFYKKTDSALRGNIGAELGAMLESGGGASLAFAPAYPMSGRITVGGIQYINGVPVGESVFAQDVYAPVKHSKIADIINEQTSINAISLPDSVYKSSHNLGNGGKKTAKAMIPANNRDKGSNRNGGDGSDGGDGGGDGGDSGGGGGGGGDGGDGGDRNVIEIYDAQSDADLANLGHYLKRCNKLKYLAGCAGFARVLPKLYEIGIYAKTTGTKTVCNASGACFFQDLPKSLLIATGSINPITLNQLAGTEDAGFKTIILTPEQKVAGVVSEVVSNVAKVLLEYEYIILAAAKTLDDITQTDECARKHGMNMVELRSRICEIIGKTIAGILRQCEIGTLVVFGGDTLHEIIKQANIPAISPIRELAPGIVESKILSECYNTRLITKSGGLGGEDTLKIIKKS